MSRIAVIGAGYVGLTTAVCLSHLGNDVRCSDIRVEHIEGLNSGASPIMEDGLKELLHKGLYSRRLTFSTNNIWAITDAEFVFLCVPTPQGNGGRADTSAIEQVVSEIGPHLASETVVVNKSTVPVGSAREVARAFRRRDIHVVSNPEFLREGTAVQDFLHPDRIVIGADDDATAFRLATLLAPLDAPAVITDPATAETIKYASNAFLATKLSFINSIASICEIVGADVRQVAIGMGYDPRIGSSFLKPGPGWGGSCLPKDVAALIGLAEDIGYDFTLLKDVESVNFRQQDLVVQKILRVVGEGVSGRKIALWGLTFKAMTNDLRDSPSLQIARRLLDLGAIVVAYDPTVTNGIDGIEVVPDPYSACVGAAALVIATEWDEFRSLELKRAGDLMERRAMVDTRNLMDPVAVRRLGFIYEGIGVV